MEISFFGKGPAYVILIVSGAAKKQSLLAVRDSKGAVYGLRAAAARRLAFDTRLRAQSPQGVKKIFDFNGN